MTEWRAYLSTLGVGPSLRYLARLMTLPRDSAVVIAACLDPVYSSLDKLLYEKYRQVVKGRYGAPLRPAGGEHDPLACLTVWPATTLADRESWRSTGRQDRNRNLLPQETKMSTCPAEASASTVLCDHSSGLGFGAAWTGATAC
jgi:hypothetical protein